MRGTGPDGRIVAEDVERFEPAAPGETAAIGIAPVRAIAAGEVERVPLTNVRKTIVRRLTEAAAVPAFQLGATIDMTETLALRERLVGASAREKRRSARRTSSRRRPQRR